MNIKLNFYGDLYELNITLHKYADNDNTAIVLIDPKEGPFATVTVNLENLPKDYAYLDTNNCPWIEQLFEEYSLGYPTGTTKISGYCEYPLYKLNLNIIDEFIF